MSLSRIELEHTSAASSFHAAPASKSLCQVSLSTNLLSFFAASALEQTNAAGSFCTALADGVFCCRTSFSSTFACDMQD